MKKQKLYSGHPHYEQERFLPYFYLINLEAISPSDITYSLKHVKGTVNFSFQLSERWASLEAATANSKHVGELQSYCSANCSVSAGNSFTVLMSSSGRH